MVFPVYSTFSKVKGFILQLWGLVLLNLALIGCHKQEAKGYIAVYNYSHRNDASVGYVEVVLPIPASQTHAVYNDSDTWDVDEYVNAGRLLSPTDTIPIMYMPNYLLDQLFTLL